jgi:fluoroquinolone resistance protein
MQDAEILSYLTDGALPDGSEVDFINAHGADFSHSVHSHCSFHFTNLHRADLRDASFTGCSFQNVDLGEALMEGATFVDCEFIGCSLVRIAAYGVRFTQCSFLRTNLLGAYLESSIVLESSFEACGVSSLITQTVAAGSVFDQVTFRSTSLEALDADSAHFLACTMDTVSMYGSLLSGANIYLSVLESVDLSAASLDAATVEDSLISGNMEGVDLSTALVKNSDLSGATGEALITQDTEIIESALSPHFTLKEEIK